MQEDDGVKSPMLRCVSSLHHCGVRQSTPRSSEFARLACGAFHAVVKQSRSNMDYFLCVLGMVFIVEGMPYFTFPGKIKAYLLKVAELPDSTLRFLGFAAILTGLLLVYLGTELR
jgi:uncharacterized protein YjeT (DUF2065 family)